MTELYQVEGYRDLRKDKSSGAIINNNKSENTRILDDSVNSTRLKMSAVGKARKCAAMQFTGNRKCKSWW